MFHLPNALLILLFSQTTKAPILEHLIVDEILINCGQLTGQYLVEELNDLLVALHNLEISPPSLRIRAKFS